ncbi:MAG TPA: ABC transporter permease [Streptosporangiaceae bacterium]|nr:ABC transporter permease [Streptosporangiaceae bacterium]
MSDTAQRAMDSATGPPPDRATSGLVFSRLRHVLAVAGQQREVTVLVVVALLIAYFGVISSGRSSFFGSVNLANLSQIAAPIVIIAIGEVMLLICGEIDLSPGFVYSFAPFLMYFLIVYDGFPVILAIIVTLLMGLLVGWVNGFLTLTLGLPSFIATLGTGFALLGITLTTSNATQASIPDNAVGIGNWIGHDAYAEIIWAVALVAIFHVVLTRTRWGLHTIAAGGNQLGAREAGINVARVKYGNFMITGVLGAFVGLQIAFQTSVIDPSAGGYQPMFYSVAAAVIGGTAMLGGSGTIIGAFLGSVMLAVLTDGFNVLGVSAYPLNIIFGGAILIAMIANIQLARLRASGRRG